MNTKKWYHDLNDVYVVFFVLLVVVVLVLTGADRCDNSKPSLNVSSKDSISLSK